MKLYDLRQSYCSIFSTIDVIDRMLKLKAIMAHVKQRFRDKKIECQFYAHEYGIDVAQVND